MARVRRTTNTTNAAFSKSVNWSCRQRMKHETCLWLDRFPASHAPAFITCSRKLGCKLPQSVNAKRAWYLQHHCDIINASPMAYNLHVFCINKRAWYYIFTMPNLVWSHAHTSQRVTWEQSRPDVTRSKDFFSLAAHLKWTKLYTPPDGRVGRGRFEPHALPVGGLDILWE